MSMITQNLGIYRCPQKLQHLGAARSILIWKEEYQESLKKMKSPSDRRCWMICWDGSSKSERQSTRISLIINILSDLCWLSLSVIVDYSLCWLQPHMNARRIGLYLLPDFKTPSIYGNLRRVKSKMVQLPCRKKSPSGDSSLSNISVQVCLAWYILNQNSLYILLYYFIGSPNGNPNPNEEVNTNAEFCCVLKTRIGGLPLLYGAEVDAVTKESQPPFLDLQNFVELKTNKHIGNEMQQAAFNRYQNTKK